MSSVSRRSVLSGTFRGRVYEVADQKGYEGLQLRERAFGPPGVGQAVIKVRYSAIAARDIGIAGNRFLGAKAANRIPLSEGSGTVVAVGPGESHVKVGDRVTACHFGGWVDGPWSPANYRLDIGNEIDGWLGEYTSLPISSLARIPDGLSDEHAGVLSGSAITAWHALHHVAHVRPGETVLTLGTGGVSTFGLQLARQAGARVVVTSSSDAKLERMRKLGADVTVNYRTEPAWGERVLALTDGRGADVVLENVGRDTLDQSMNACAPNARIVMIGTGPLPKELPKMPGFYVKNLSMKAISNGSRRMLEELMDAMVKGRIDPVIDRVFSFDQAIEAYRFFDASTHIGKVAIRHF